MKIEALEDIKSHGLVLTAGDAVTVPDDIGSALCAAGWAKDLDGSVATGERRVLNAKITVQSAAQPQTADNLEG